MSHIDYEQSTRFIGREEDIAQIARMLDDPHCRLITIVGVGGIGKTRLALQVANGLENRFENGIPFVNLQPVQSSDLIASAIADALGVALSGQNAFDEQLLDYLQNKNILLLLDNFEHLLGGVDFLPRIIQRAPAAKLLVTSREALNLQEEWLYPLDGLPTPMSHEVDHLESYEAIRLFVDRAHHVRPTFSEDRQRAGIVRICQMVGGLPLAIEMAASWTKTLRCSEITAEIQTNIHFLSTTHRNVPVRHRSMQAVFSQTWGRMSEEEKALFPRLAIFRGGFRYDAAQAVAGASLVQITSLLDKCLLRRDAAGRYQVHELLRQYAEERLDEGSAHTVLESHCQFYANFMAERRVVTAEGDQVRGSKEIEEELENVRAAMQYALEHGLADVLTKTAPTFFFFGQIQSRYLETTNFLEKSVAVLRQVGEERTAAQVSVYLGWMLMRLGRIQQAATVLERSLELFQELDITPLPHGMGSAPRSPMIVLRVIQGDYAEAVAVGEQCVAESLERSDLHNLAFAYYGLTSAHFSLGNYDRAAQYAQWAVARAREVGNEWVMGYFLIEGGRVLRAMGKYKEAERHFQACYEMRQNYNDPEGVAVALNHLGDLARLQQNYQDAQRLYEDSLFYYQDLNDKGGIAAVYQGLGQLAFQTDKLHTAAKEYRRALSMVQEIHFVPLLLSIIIDIGELFFHAQDVDRGRTLLYAVLNHPASTQQQRDNAASHLKSMSESLSAGPEVELPDLEEIIPELEAKLLAIAAAESQQEQKPVGQPLIDPLTPRELEILQLIAEGLSNPDIAERCYLAVGTVKAHTSRIYSKLDVENRVQAVARAHELSLIGAHND